MPPCLPGFPPPAFPTSFLPHIRSVHLSTVNSSPRPGIAPQSLNFSSQLLSLLGYLCPCPGHVWLQQRLSILIPFRVPQISCFTLSLKCFSSDPHSCPDVGIGPLLQVPHPPRAGLVLVTVLFFPPSSFILPSFLWFCIFFFHWSGTPVSSQLVFSLNFCV